MKNNEFEHAITVYENALKIRTNDPNIYHNLGVTWSKIGKIDKALDNYLKAKTLNSKNSLTYYNLAYLYLQNFNFELSKLKEAELNFNKAIEIHSTNEKFYYNLALVQSRLKKYNIAIDNYKKSIKINQNYTKAKYNLSRLYLATENFEKGWPLYYKPRIKWHKKIEKKPWYKERVKNFQKLNC